MRLRFFEAGAAERASAAAEGAGAQRAAGRSAKARGFSLLELIAVLVIMAMALALAAPALARAGARSAERRALAQMIDGLRAARAHAVASHRSASARIAIAQDAATIEGGGAPIRVKPWPFRALSAEADFRSAALDMTPPKREIRVRFEPSGRTAAGALIAASSRGDRLWRIAFDPVSGALTLRLLDQEESP